MKTTNWIFKSLLIALLAIGFASCSDKDEEEDDLLPLTLDFKSDKLELGVASEQIIHITNGAGSYKVVSENNQTVSATLNEKTVIIKALTAGTSVVSISDKKGEKKINVTVKDGVWQKEGVYVLNAGSNTKNNSVLAYYTSGEKVYQEIFEAANGGLKLGDTGNNAIVYGSKIYIAVSTSQIIMVTDLNGKKINSYTLDKENSEPRYLTAANGYVYASFFNGYAAKIDTTGTTSIVADAQVGTYPEQLQVSGNKLFVTNSGYGKGNTVSVIDLATFKEEKKIEVVLNPDKMQVDKNGDIYIISMGTYGEPTDEGFIPGTLQKIDPKTYEVKTLGNATIMTMNEDKSVIYAIFNQWKMEDQKASYCYDVNKGIMEKKSFIKDETKLNGLFSLAVNPANGDIYITTSDWVTNGKVLIFSKDGVYKEEFTAHLNPTVFFKPVKK